MGLEEALQDQEERVDVLLKSGGRYVAALKAWKKACQTGHMANLARSSAAAADIVPTLIAPVEEARAAWTFDVRDYLEGDSWRSEVRETAERMGLRILEEGENLISSPVVVRPLPGRGAVALGRATWPALRPKVLVAELKRLREKTAASNSQEFLDGLYAATQFLSKEPSPFAKFRDLYDLFGMTPGWRKDNPLPAFGQSIYALQRSEINTTRNGRKFDFVTPSGNPKERDILNVIAEDGRTLRYYGIHFR